MAERIRRPEGFRPLRRRDNGVNRKRVEVLRRRVDYLDRRIEEHDYNGHEKHWDEAELAALKWAIKLSSEWVLDDPLFDVEWSGCKFVDEASLQDLVDLLGTAAYFKGKRCEVVGMRWAEKKGDRKVARVTLRPLADDESPTFAHTSIGGGRMKLIPKTAV